MGESSPALSAVDRRCEQVMRLRAQGMSWRAIGQKLNTDPGNLYRACVARDYNSEQQERRAYFAKLHAEIADEAGRQLLGRLQQQGDSLSPKELAVVAGISTDKVRDAEGWTRQSNDGTANWLATLAERLTGGQELELKVTKREPTTINVTPEGEAE